MVHINLFLGVVLAGAGSRLPIWGFGPSKPDSHPDVFGHNSSRLEHLGGNTLSGNAKILSKCATSLRHEPSTLGPAPMELHVATLAEERGRVHHCGCHGEAAGAQAPRLAGCSFKFPLSVVTVSFQSFEGSGLGISVSAASVLCPCSVPVELDPATAVPHPQTRLLTHFLRRIC